MIVLVNCISVAFLINNAASKVDINVIKLIFCRFCCFIWDIYLSVTYFVHRFDFRLASFNTLTNIAVFSNSNSLMYVDQVL